MVLLRRGKSMLNIFHVQRCDRHVHSHARLDHRRDRPSDQQRDRRDHFEINERLDPDPPEAFHITHSGDAGDHRRENDRRDHHSNQPDETITQRLQISSGEIELAAKQRELKRSFVRREIADHYSQTHSDQDPKIKLLIITFGRGTHEGLSAGVLHSRPSYQW
jgi:hypothetical protein